MCFCRWMARCDWGGAGRETGPQFKFGVCSTANPSRTGCRFGCKAGPGPSSRRVGPAAAVCGHLTTPARARAGGPAAGRVLRVGPVLEPALAGLQPHRLPLQARAPLQQVRVEPPHAASPVKTGVARRPAAAAARHPGGCATRCPSLCRCRRWMLPAAVTEGQASVKLLDGSVQRTFGDAAQT